VVDHQPVEQVDVGVAQVAEIEVLVDGGGLERQLLQASRRLRLVALDVGRDEAVGAEVFPGGRRVGGVIIPSDRGGSAGVGGRVHRKHNGPTRLRPRSWRRLRRERLRGFGC